MFNAKLSLAELCAWEKGLFKKLSNVGLSIRPSNSVINENVQTWQDMLWDETK